MFCGFFDLELSFSILIWQAAGSGRLGYVEPVVVLQEQLQALFGFDLDTHTSLRSGPVVGVLHDAEQDPPMDALDIRCCLQPVQGRHQDKIGIQLPRVLGMCIVINALVHSLSKLQGPGVKKSSRLDRSNRCHAEDTGADEPLQELEESEGFKHKMAASICS